MKAKKEIFKFIIILFLIWRVLSLGVMYFSTTKFSHNSNFPQYFGCGIDVWQENPLICSLSNFDGVHYLGISQLGYADYEQAFFPLYPVLIRFLGEVLGGNYLLAGLFISNICFFASLFLLYKLVRLDFSDKTARWTVVFLILFPTSFFFGAVYTESLFLMLVLFSFWAARTNRWWLAGIAGLLASGTRFVGIFLLPALFLLPVLLFECVKQVQDKKTKVIKLLAFRLFDRKMPGGLGVCHSFFYLLMIPLGLIIYMVYLSNTTGDPLNFIHSQSIWQRESFVILPQVFWRYLKKVFLYIVCLVGIFTAYFYRHFFIYAQVRTGDFSLICSFGNDKEQVR